MQFAEEETEAEGGQSFSKGTRLGGGGSRVAVLFQSRGLSANYKLHPVAQSGPPPGSVNKVSLEHSHTHSRLYCLRLL